MKAGGDYQVVLKKAHPKYIPKKVLRHQKIPVSDKYTFNASIWIADTPESNLRPSVNLTLQHNGERLRFCFHNVPDMILAIGELEKFVGCNAVMVDNKHREALRQYLDFHEAEKHPPIDDYTVLYSYTREKTKHLEGTGIVYDQDTGEILETTPVDETIQPSVGNISKQQSKTGEDHGEIQKGSVR